MMPKCSSSSSAMGSSSSTTFCDGYQKPFKRIQAHLSHNPACSSIYASWKSLIDPYAGVGGTVIDSAAKAAQYHASLSSFIVTGGSMGQQESRSCQRFPAPFEFAVDDTNNQDEVDDVSVFGDDESDPPPPLPAPPDPFVNATTDRDEGVLELYEELLRLESNPFSSLVKFSREEKVHIELLHLLKDLKAPLSALQ